MGWGVPRAFGAFFSDFLSFRSPGFLVKPFACNLVPPRPPSWPPSHTLVSFAYHEKLMKSGRLSTQSRDPNSPGGRDYCWKRQPKRSVIGVAGLFNKELQSRIRAGGRGQINIIFSISQFQLQCFLFCFTRLSGEVLFYRGGGGRFVSAVACAASQYDSMLMPSPWPVRLAAACTLHLYLQRHWQGNAQRTLVS